MNAQNGQEKKDLQGGAIRGCERTVELCRAGTRRTDSLSPVARGYAGPDYTTLSLLPFISPFSIGCQWPLNNYLPTPGCEAETKRSALSSVCMVGRGTLQAGIQRRTL